MTPARSLARTAITASEHPGRSDAPETIAYAIPNRLADFVYVAAPIPVGAWRAVRHTATGRRARRLPLADV